MRDTHDKDAETADKCWVNGLERARSRTDSLQQAGKDTSTPSIPHQSKPSLRPVYLSSCLICFGREGNYRLVRDHDHSTGMIRGLLCDHCNTYLGILEEYPQAYWLRTVRIGRMRGVRWRRWVREYVSEIAQHLKRDTGVRYE